MSKIARNMKKKYPAERSFVVPACVIVAVATQVPFILTIIFSALQWNIVRPDQGITFSGLDNFSYYLGNPEFYTICLQTIVMIGAALLLCLIFGYLIALMLDCDIPGKTISRTLILSPFFIMTTTTGVLWKTVILNTNFGWVGTIADWMGIKAVDFVSYYARPLVVFCLCGSGCRFLCSSFWEVFRVSRGKCWRGQAWMDAAGLRWYLRLSCR